MKKENQTKNIKTIVFTGGHHNSALVLAKLLCKRGFKIIWFGHKHTMFREKSLSAEFLEVKEAGIPFIELKTGKFYRTLNPLILAKIPFGFFQAFSLLIKYKPSLIVSFGGYLSVPVVLAGWFLKVPSVTHEQTTTIGVANKLISFFAKKIFLTWDSSKKFFPENKLKVVGLPVRKELLNLKKEKSFFQEKLPTILILGGKQGSHILNQTIMENLTFLLQKYNLIHQTGFSQKTKDFEKLKNIKKGLSVKLKKRYVVKPYFFKKELVQVLKITDLVISRSGAHIVYELALMGKPAVLIPYPWSYQKEQEFNARLLADNGGALLLEQKNLRQFKNQIDDVINNLDKFRQKALAFRKNINSDAAEVMLREIEKLLIKN